MRNPKLFRDVAPAAAPARRERKHGARTGAGLGSARRRSRGTAMLEVALISPWVFMLFIGALDWGFYSYALITLQSAARSTALYTSESAAAATDTITACNIVLAEMRSLPNIGSSVTTCDSNPNLTLSSVPGPDLAPASQVSVRYQTVRLIPIPGLLTNQITITRTVKMRLRS